MLCAQKAKGRALWLRAAQALGEHRPGLAIALYKMAVQEMVPSEQAKYARSRGDACEAAFFATLDDELPRLERALARAEHENNMVTFESEASPATAAAALPEPAVLSKPEPFEANSPATSIEVNWAGSQCIIM